MGIYFQIHSFIQAHINYCSSLWGLTSKSTALSRHTSTTALHYGDCLPNPQLYPGTHQLLLFIMGIVFQIHSFIQAHINYCSSLWGFSCKSTALSRHTATTALHYGDLLPNPQLLPGTHQLLLFIMGIDFQIHSFIQAHINYCSSLWGLSSKSTALSRHTSTTALHYGDLLPNPQLYPGTHKLLLFVKGIYFQIHSFIQAHINY